MAENTTTDLSGQISDSNEDGRKSPDANWRLIAGGALLLILVVVIIFWRMNSSSPASKPQPDSSAGQFIAPLVGVEIRSTSGTELPLLQPIDQSLLGSTLQQAWTDAITKAPQNAVKFPNDPNLVAFQISLPDQVEPKSFVVYANRPVIVETNQVESLPGDQVYQLDYDRENYQLVIKFSYTSQVTALDLPQVLTETFNQILNQRRLPQDVENNPITTQVFEALGQKT